MLIYIDFIFDIIEKSIVKSVSRITGANKHEFLELHAE